MIRALIRFVTVAAMLGALAVSIVWSLRPEWEWLQAPGTALALVAAVAGIPAERWAAETQRRARALAAIGHELRQNREVLGDGRFKSENQGLGQVYPRLILSAVDTAFIANSLDAYRDHDLRRRLLEWRSAAEDLNRRLDLTEQRLCMLDQLGPDELTSLREIRRPNGYFDRVCQLLEELERAIELATAGPPWLWRLPRPAADREQPQLPL